MPTESFSQGPSPRSETESGRLPLGVAPALVAAALALQIYLPLLFPILSLLDLALVMVVYLAILRRNALWGLFTGAAIGLAQDALTHGPLGLFGIINSIIGYFAASISLYIEVEYPGARAVLVGLFFLAHEALFWVMQGALLGSDVLASPPQALILSAVHAGLALLLYPAFDHLKRPT